MKPTKNLIGKYCWYQFHLWKITSFGFNAEGCWLIIEFHGDRQKVDLLDVEIEK